MGRIGQCWWFLWLTDPQCAAPNFVDLVLDIPAASIQDFKSEVVLRPEAWTLVRPESGWRSFIPVHDDGPWRMLLSSEPTSPDGLFPYSANTEMTLFFPEESFQRLETFFLTSFGAGQSF